MAVLFWDEVLPNSMSSAWLKKNGWRARTSRTPGSRGSAQVP
jgi:hypothetical protein